MTYTVACVLLFALITIAPFYLKRRPDIVASLNKTIVDTSLSKPIEKTGKEVLGWTMTIIALVVYFLVIEPYRRQQTSDYWGKDLWINVLNWIDIIGFLGGIVLIITTRFKNKDN